MKKKISREIVSYLFFGVLTTIVNYAVFAIGINIWQEEKALQVNMVAFVCATLFAFVTNKIFVFKSKKIKCVQVMVELGQFVFARLFSLGIEQAGLLVCIKYLKIGQYIFLGMSGLMIAKIVLSFVSVLLNYIASKFIVFAQKENK